MLRAHRPRTSGALYVLILREKLF